MIISNETNDQIATAAMKAIKPLEPVVLVIGTGDEFSLARQISKKKGVSHQIIRKDIMDIEPDKAILVGKVDPKIRKWLSNKFLRQSRL